MTDRERLLEQVREASDRAADASYYARCWIQDDTVDMADFAANYAKLAAHHALTAMALRDVIEATDEVVCPNGFWIDGERWR